MQKDLINNAKKERLYEAAKQLFYDKGFKQTTLKDIGQTADANTALVAYYYKNKTNLAIEINTEYLAATKVLTKYYIDRICPNAGLYLQTAVDIRVTNRNYVTSPELMRFYLELNETNFYIKSEIVSTGFFENLNRSYHLGFDRNYLRAAAIANYALANALSAARVNGLMDCTNEYIIASVINHHGIMLGFPEEKTQSVLDESLAIANKINIHVGSGFRLFHDDKNSF
ncbi:MAG: TetR family transcriptional regulator [Eubacterium sp.]